MNSFEGNMSKIMLCLSLCIILSVVASAQYSFLVSGFPSPATAGTQGLFTVTAKDQFGDTYGGYRGTVHFTSSDAQAVLPSDYTFAPSDNGTKAFYATLKTAGANMSVAVTDNATPTFTGQQAGISVVAGLAAELAFTVNPDNVITELPISPPVQVKVFDSYANLVTAPDFSIDLQLWVNPGGASLNGTVSRTTSSGVATFDDLHLDKAGVGYQLRATCGSLNSALSQPFDVSETVPVELLSFTVTSKINTVELKWNTAAEVNNYGFEIGRNTFNNWEKIGFVEGAGTTSAPNDYSFIEKDLSAGRYLYRLKQIDRDGKFEYSQQVEVTVAGALKEFALEQNFPNPFNPVTVINYQLPQAGSASINVYDVLGRKVVSLVNELKEAGTHSISFDASKLSSGLYYYSLQAGEFVAIKPMVLMK
jgi:hypothetical protein